MKVILNSQDYANQIKATVEKLTKSSDLNEKFEQYLYANLGLNLVLFGKESTANYFLKQKRVCVRVTDVANVYPELKESGPNSDINYYVLCSFDSVTKTLVIEGFITQNELFSEKNFYKEKYVVSYYDLQPIVNLCTELSTTQAQESIT